MNREDESTRNLLSRSSAYAPPPSTFKLPNRFVKSRKLQCITTALLFCFVLAAVWIFAPARSATYSQNYDARPPTNITRPTRPTRPTPPPPPPPQYLPDKPLHPKFRTGKGRHRGVINYTFGDGSAYEKPLDTKIYGLVFYGRWDRVQILDCYLKVWIRDSLARS